MRFRNLIICCLSASALYNCTDSNQPPEDAFINNLLGKMTLEEKIGQLNQVSSSGNYDDMAGMIRKGMVGSILNETTAENVNNMQAVAMKESRLGIPVLFSRDVIHGYKTIFPIPLGQAATFNPEIAEQGARIAAIESAADGIRWTFAPMIDISRDPRWGRIAESCGEDPYLTTVMGCAMIKGFQGDSLSSPSSIAACAKHFIGYGAAEGGRDYNSTNIPQRQLQNVYMPPFQAAVNIGCATFMTSFNDNDGIPASGNRHLIKDILRKDWGFDGFVVSDWTSIYEMIPHGYSSDMKDAALKGINAGVDMEMVSGSYFANLAELIKEKKVSESSVDDAVRNILRVKYRLGLFKNPYIEIPQSVKYAPEHLAAAKLAAEESAILLKNENKTLPISSDVHSIAVVGPLANAPYEQMGTWVFDGEKDKTQTPLMALKEIYDNQVRINYEPALAYSRDKQTQGIAKAVQAARNSDLIVAFVGEESILSGEAHCLADLNLQGAQSELIAQLKKTGKPMVMIVMAGRQLTIAEQAEKADAVIYMFHPGTMGGPAIADLLFGKSVPSGKTPVTFPKMVGQIPLYYSHNNTGRPAQHTETLLCDIPVEAGQTSLGCTSFYMDAGFDPLYPFGYGLSYTTFSFADAQLNASEFGMNDEIKASVLLSNTGDYKATEVVQLYVQDKVGSTTRPVKELKRFARITLEPGESQRVSFTLPVKELAFCNAEMKNIVEPGEFNLWIGPDSQNGQMQQFSVK